MERVRRPAPWGPQPARARVPVWFLSPSPADHVTHHAGGGEYVTTWSDDVRFYTPARTGWPRSERDFDASFLGWGEDINGVRVYSPDTPPPLPPPEDLMNEKLLPCCTTSRRTPGRSSTWTPTRPRPSTPTGPRLMAGVHDVEIQEWNAGDITYLL